jgi:hypothetical protein
MTNQPFALRLADAMEANGVVHGAAELRRLHEENERLRIVAGMSTLLLDQRKLLLEAAQDIVDFVNGPVEAKRPDVFFLRISKVRAAIAAVEGEKE